jgi:lipopolysaccharide export LptBFGC system permease protein LptF
MVLTLHRYIFRELLRIFILATIGLTLILSLGGILHPVQEYGVGPQQVVHILVYFMPITLTFVLPMAALFASALTYGRFAGDNELDACRASGIGIFTLVYPGFVLTVLVAIANLLLSFHVMPYFVRLAEKSLKADAKQILFRNIQRRGFYRPPTDGRYQYLIYADHADPKEDMLFGIVVVQSGQQGIRRIITSEVTQLQFDPHDKFNEVHLTTYNAKQMGQADDLWGEIGTASFKREFGSLLGDDIKFKRIREMKQIRADLMQFDPIARMARETYAQLATELLAQDISETLAASPAGSYELRGASRSVRFCAAACKLEEKASITLVPPVVVDECDPRSGARRRRLRCERAEIRVEESTAEPSLSLDLHSARVEETGQLQVRSIIRDLALPDQMKQSLSREPILQVVAPDRLAAILGGPPGPILRRQQRALLHEMTDTLVDIKAEINSRLVFGIGCLPMILIGIGLGILQRGGHLLGAFGASCLPAAVLVVAIISGKNITKNIGAESSSGILVMWGGLAFLVVLAALIYRRLRRS